MGGGSIGQRGFEHMLRRYPDPSQVSGPFFLRMGFKYDCKKKPMFPTLQEEKQLDGMTFKLGNWGKG